MSDEQTQEKVDVISPMEFITTAAGADMCIMGPLAQAYSEGLEQLYAKDRTDNGVALETQAMDAGLAKRAILAKQPLLNQNDQAAMSILYGIQKGSVSVKNIVDIVDASLAMSDAQKQSSAVILDASLQNDPGQTPRVLYDVAIHPNEVALERYCAKNNIPVYSSLEDFIKHIC